MPFDQIAGELIRTALRNKHCIDLNTPIAKGGKHVPILEAASE